MEEDSVKTPFYYKAEHLAQLNKNRGISPIDATQIRLRNTKLMTEIANSLGL
jgi:hypothetical protein